jgi:NADPH-dependent 7-cyano-7-deazaguanine reductase QueF
MLEALSSPALSRITLTVGEIESRCPVNGERDISDVEVSFVPNGLTVEAGSLVTWLMGFEGEELTSEDFANRIADAVEHAAAPSSLTVRVSQRPAPTCLLVVEATRP